MFKITIQDLHEDSPSCNKPGAGYREGGCAGFCGLRFRVFFKCPYCSTIKHFYGTNNPVHCTVCKRKLPDVYALQVKHHYSRIKYHQEAQ